MAARLHEAAESSLGEFVEDPEFEAAKNEQSFVEGRIRELELLLANAMVITKSRKKNGLVEIGKELINSYQLHYCVITLEEYGSLAVSDSGEVVYNPGFKVNLADPLGAGDAFTAGFVDALLREKSLKEASESGNQLGALVATQQGATQKVIQDDLNKIALKNIRIFDQHFSKYAI